MIKLEALKTNALNKLKCLPRSYEETIREAKLENKELLANRMFVMCLADLEPDFISNEEMHQLAINKSVISQTRLDKDVILTYGLTAPLNKINDLIIYFVNHLLLEFTSAQNETALYIKRPITVHIDSNQAYISFRGGLTVRRSTR